MTSVLIAGPCISEFGWELMEFQGRVRALAKRHDHVVVCSTESLRPLYTDFNPIFVGHKIRSVRDCHVMRSIETPAEWDRVMAVLSQHKREFEARGCKVRWEHSRPSRGTVGTLHAMDQQSFIRYGNADAAKARDRVFDVLLHARNKEGVNPYYRIFNWPIEKWNTVVKALTEQGLKLAAIGTKTEALLPTGAVDLRGLELSDLMDTMRAAKLIIGPSSGPMHLASLCGTPHFVWTSKQWSSTIKADNRGRYTRVWNPLKTKCWIIDERPDVGADIVVAEIKKIWPELPCTSR